MVSGDVVYPVGATGDNPEADLAKSDSYMTCRPIAMTTENIGNNSVGYATIFGRVKNLDTSMWEEGDLLYVSCSTAGQSTNVKPNYPCFAMRVGVVLRKHATEGIVIVDSAAESNIYTHGSVLIGNGNGEIGEEPEYLNWDTNTKTFHTSGLDANTATIGTSADYTEFENDGTIVAHGEATTWRDELHELTGEKLESPSAEISLNSSEGSLTFSSVTTLYDYILTNVQINHDWKMGSDIYPHLHWWQVSSNIPNWLIQYRWQINGELKTETWTSQTWETSEFTYSSGTLNQIVSFGAITPPVGYFLSDIVQFRIIRDTNNDSGLFNTTDAETADVDAVSFDIHIECDTLGSRQEYIK